MAEKNTVATCELDGRACLPLSAILESFNAPINEEHAWAVCYQCAKCLQREWLRQPQRCLRLTQVRQILLHRDGSVHTDTALQEDQTDTRLRAATEFQLLNSLGVVIFHALDYGLPEDEECNLSPPLEQLIDLMTSTDDNEMQHNDEDDEADDRHEADDEGIERDAGDDDELSSNRLLSTGVSLAKVLEICANHLSTPSQADSHYKAVCRALVAEALELSTFLHKISQGTEELKQLRRNAPDSSDSSNDLEKLRFTDWARLWVQVIRELRQGVKLKKVVVESNPSPIEYELTPYEILMDDIRSRRYKLNKVMINGDIPPRVKKDAHAIILEFIRSRPPLHPVAERKLKPVPPKPSSPYEDLMRSIRQEHKLKPTTTKTVETSRTKLDDSDSTPQPTRRLIKADLSLLQLDDFDQEEDDEYLPSPVENGHVHGFCVEEKRASKANKNVQWQRTALDLATQKLSFKPERRHSITVCESPTKSQSEVSQTREPPTGGGGVCRHQPVSLPAQLLSLKDPAAVNGNHNHNNHPNVFQSTLKNSVECLSLTLEEVVHIRNVLTKAELEGLLVDKSLYEEVSKGKVCFTCKKTRFSFFGQWGQKCRLCTRNICERCCTKMHIPHEHFANIPVFTLSPGSSSSSDEDSSPRSLPWRLPDVSSFLSRRMSAGSAPSSPNLPRRQPHLSPTMSSSVSSTPVGTPVAAAISAPTAKQRRPLLRSRTLNRTDSVRREQLRGELMTVCKDCRGMVRHAIVANRRQHKSIREKSKSRLAAPSPHGNGTAAAAASTGLCPPSRDLHLNLSPIY